MTFTYFNEIPNKSTCVGNSLSTIGIALTSLAWNLSSLSAYTVSSINFLQTQINYISANVPTYNYVQTNFVNTSGDVMTGSLSAPTLCATNFYVGASTINFFDVITKQVVGTFSNLDNTNYRRTFATVSATSANWGGGKAFTSIAYVDPNLGSNTTGNGTSTRPWATVQKAVDEGYFVVYLGPGNGGTLNVTSNLTLYILGSGRFNSRLNLISTNGNTFNLIDLGKFSFGYLAASINAEGPSVGAAGSQIGLYGIYFPGAAINIYGAGGSGVGGIGGNGGVLIAEDCEIGNIVANGGNGADGDSITVSGDGGMGGFVQLKRCVTGSIDCGGGNQGLDGGGGQGNAGTPGELNSDWSTIDSVLSVATGLIRANIVGGTFFASGYV